MITIKTHIRSKQFHTPLLRLLLCASLAVICSCSKDTGTETSAEAEAQAETVATPEQHEQTQTAAEEAISYRQVPEAWFAPATQPATGPATALLSFEEQLARRNWDVADQEYRQVLARNAGNGQLRLMSGMQFVRATMALIPPDLGRARAVLDSLQAARADEHMPSGFADELAWWGLVVELHDAADALAETAALDKLSTVIAALPTGLRSSQQYAPLLGSIDRLVAAAASAENALQLETILRQLQLQWPWPGLIAEIQRRRVQILLDSHKKEDALFEARLSLALSSHDPVLWRLAFEQACAVVAALTGRPPRAQELVDSWYQPRDAAGRENAASERTSNPLSGAGRQLLQCNTGVQSPGNILSTIRSACCETFSGRPDQARSILLRIVESSQVPSQDEMDMIVFGLSSARAMADAHPLESEAFAFDWLEDTDVAPLWKEAAIRFLDSRTRLVQDLITTAQVETALALCRAMAEAPLLPERSRQAVSLAMEACRKRAGSTEQATLDLFSEFGQGLTNPVALEAHAAHLARALHDSGDIPGAVAQLQKLSEGQRTGHRCDPELDLLHATCLLRTGDSRQSLGIAQELEQRLDISNDLMARTRLLLGAIYLQEGDLPKARKTLRQIMADAPPLHVARAESILDQLEW